MQVVAACACCIMFEWLLISSSDVKTFCLMLKCMLCVADVEVKVLDTIDEQSYLQIRNVISA